MKSSNSCHKKYPPTISLLSEKYLTTNVHDNEDRDRDKEGLGGCFYDSKTKDMNPPTEVSSKGSDEPLPLYYSEGKYPVRDTAFLTVRKNLILYYKNNIELYNDGVGGIFSYSETSTFPPKCYRCDCTNFNTKGEYEYHCLTKHPGLPGYPGPADIKESNLTPQGMSWET